MKQIGILSSAKFSLILGIQINFLNIILNNMIDASHIDYLKILEKIDSLKSHIDDLTVMFNIAIPFAYSDDFNCESMKLINKLEEIESIISDYKYE